LTAELANEILTWLSLLGITAGTATIIRNNAVLRIRAEILLNPKLSVAFRNKRHSSLPSYEAMVFSPKYWLLWSTESWERWIDRHMFPPPPTEG
jgi:hypothetical protein